MDTTFLCQPLHSIGRAQEIYHNDGIIIDTSGTTINFLEAYLTASISAGLSSQEGELEAKGWSSQRSVNFVMGFESNLISFSQTLSGRVPWLGFGDGRIPSDPTDWCN